MKCNFLFIWMLAVAGLLPAAAAGDLQQLFFLPAEKDARRTVERTEFLLCCRLVELLGGFLYIEPEFKDGRRVVFQVAL